MGVCVVRHIWGVGDRWCGVVVGGGGPAAEQFR